MLGTAYAILITSLKNRGQVTASAIVCICKWPVNFIHIIVISSIIGQCIQVGNVYFQVILHSVYRVVLILIIRHGLIIFKD